MTGKVCFSYVFNKNKSSPTASLNTKDFGERLTIGPAGRFNCVWLLQEGICAWFHQGVVHVPMCGLMDAPCSRRICELQWVFLVNRVATRTHGCCREVLPLKSEGTRCNIACTFVVVTLQKSVHWTLRSLLLCSLSLPPRWPHTMFFHNFCLFDSSE